MSLSLCRYYCYVAKSVFLSLVCVPFGLDMLSEPMFCCSELALRRTRISMLF